jgi:hypothetical protein
MFKPHSTDCAKRLKFRMLSIVQVIKKPEMDFEQVRLLHYIIKGQVMVYKMQLKCQQRGEK